MENRIKSARLAAGLTQDEMSKRFGIPLATIKRWDSGVSIPPEWAARLLLEKLEEEKKSLVRCKEEKGK
jgi:DNA-binding transcriptional regulator YiaG|nr:MAG TPA: helix-turn-helix XRE-family like protein [Caudoviricetes sp.]DAH66442.1 MAG TPA: Helix-turn-helix XRE-family like protein [Caudoviricetes sp.]